MSDNVKYPMPETSAEYTAKILESMERSAEVRKLIEAAHHVLAGGKVEIKVIKSGDTALVEALTAMAAEARRLSNEANKAAGTYVTVV